MTVSVSSPRLMHTMYGAWFYVVNPPSQTPQPPSLAPLPPHQSINLGSGTLRTSGPNRSGGGGREGGATDLS